VWYGARYTVIMWTGTKLYAADIHEIAVPSVLILLILSDEWQVAQQPPCLLLEVWMWRQFSNLKFV